MRGENKSISGSGKQLSKEDLKVDPMMFVTLWAIWETQPRTFFIDLYGDKRMTGQLPHTINVYFLPFSDWKIQWDHEKTQVG